MRKLLRYLVVLLFFAGMVSCKKNKSSISRQQIEVTIKSNADYSYDLGGYGDEEGVSISRQATHYQTSSVLRDSTSSNITYKYKPAQDYIGVDDVELKSTKDSDGVGPGGVIVITTLKFTIAN